MELSSLKLKKLSSGGKLQSLNIKQKNLFKVVSYDVFSVFATVRHREIPCEANVM